MKILCLSRDYSIEYYNPTRELLYSIADVIDMDIVWWSVDVEFINEYDIVILHNIWNYGELSWKDVTAVKCFVVEDVQYTQPTRFFKRRMAYLTLQATSKYFDYAFVKSPLAWKELWPKTNFKDVFPFPNCINTNIIKDYKETKDINILLIGSIKRQYPIRYKMAKLFEKRNDFILIDKKKNRITDGVEYSKMLNRSKISCSCSSIYKYTLAKCFEIPGSMSALLSDLTPDMKNLGFKDGVNMIVYDDNVEEKVDYYLNNSHELDVLTQNGYQLIREKHTTEIRVKEFLQYLGKIL